MRRRGCEKNGRPLTNVLPLTKARRCLWQGVLKAVIQSLLIMATSMYRLGGQFGPGRFTGLRLANNRRVRVSLTD